MSSEYIAMLASTMMSSTQAPNSWFRNNFKNFKGSRTRATGSVTVTPRPTPMASATAFDTLASCSRISLHGVSARAEK
jgi:hypothetical protein